MLDLTQPTAEELAGKIEAQQAAFVYLHAHNLCMSSDELPKAQGTCTPDFGPC